MSKLIVTFGVISLSWGLGVSVFQAYYWLRYGVKLNISVLDALFYFNEHLWPFYSWDWLTKLRGFTDIYRRLDQISFALLLVVFGLVLLVFARFIAQLERERRAKRVVQND
jgi:hypothetical protein